MKREKLIQFIDMAISKEEEAVEETSLNIATAINFIGCTEDEKARCLKSLKQLHDESSVHRNILLNIKKKIESEDRDDY